MSDWDAPTPREPLESDGWPAQRRKKNTKRWCRGKAGVEHEPEFVLRTNHLSRPVTCHWALYYVRGITPKPRWWCTHQERCSKCGKIVDHFPEGVRCPRYVPWVWDVDKLECRCGHPMDEHSNTGWRTPCTTCPAEAECRQFRWVEDQR